MNIGHLFIVLACLWLVVAIAYGFYRVGLQLGAKRMFLVRQELVRIESHLRVTKPALLFIKRQDCKEDIHRNIIHRLVPEITKYVTIEESEDFQTQDILFQGFVYVGTKEKD